MKNNQSVTLPLTISEACYFYPMSFMNTLPEQLKNDQFKQIYPVEYGNRLPCFRSGPLLLRKAGGFLNRDERTKY